MYSYLGKSTFIAFRSSLLIVVNLLLHGLFINQSRLTGKLKLPASFKLSNSCNTEVTEDEHLTFLGLDLGAAYHSSGKSFIICIQRRICFITRHCSQTSHFIMRLVLLLLGGKNFGGQKEPFYTIQIPPQQRDLTVTSKQILAQIMLNWKIWQLMVNAISRNVLRPTQTSVVPLNIYLFVY